MKSKIFEEGSKLILKNGMTIEGGGPCEVFIGALCNENTIKVIKDVSKGFSIGCAIAGLTIAGSIVYDHVKTKRKEKLVKEAKKVSVCLDKVIDSIEGCQKAEES